MITSVKLSPFWFYCTVDTPQTWITEVYRDVLVYVVFRRLESGVTTRGESIEKTLTVQSKF